MKAKIYIPYANGDCVRGFRYDKHITREQYAKMQLDEYNGHKNGIDFMVDTRFGNNMAINNFRKEKRNYTQQTYQYHECQCNILNIEGKEQTLADFDDLYRTKQKFVIIVHLKKDDVRNQPDLETDVNMWIKDSNKIKRCQRLTDEEALLHLPKKDFKIYIDEDKSTAVLKDCKLLDNMGSNTSMAILVDKIVFVKG